MHPNTGILSGDCEPQLRFIPDYETLKQQIEALRTLGLTVVLTSGSFDLLHIGHARYLRLARLQGDVLIVGLESDERVRKRKEGEDRPVVPEGERVEALTHTRYVTYVTLKNEGDPKWYLIKTVRPDVLVISERTHYNDADIERLGKFCGKVVCLEAQAETSTSAHIRKMQMGGLRRAIVTIRAAVAELEEGVT